MQTNNCQRWKDDVHLAESGKFILARNFYRWNKYFLCSNQSWNPGTVTVAEVKQILSMLKEIS